MSLVIVNLQEPPLAQRAHITAFMATRDELWMSHWGMLGWPSSRFIGRRPLRVLNGSVTPIRVPDWLRGHAYNPSIVPLGDQVRQELNCTQCRFALSTRVDWATGCQARPHLEVYNNAERHQLGRRKLSLITLISDDWTVIAWGWLQLVDQFPAMQLRLQDELRMHSAATIVDSRLFTFRDRLWLVGSRPLQGTQWEASYGPLHLRMLGAAHATGRPRPLLAWQEQARTHPLTGDRCSGRSQAICAHNHKPECDCVTLDPTLFQFPLEPLQPLLNAELDTLSLTPAVSFSYNAHRHSLI